MQALTERQRRQISEYLLSDYQFLEDYQVLEHPSVNGNSFVAVIRNTDQKVRFIRREYSSDCLPRFKALHRLYKNGIILADNMFILEEGEALFYYIIEAEVSRDCSRFNTFQQYLYEAEISEDEKKCFIGKIKILLDCLHQEGQSFAGLDPRKIVIDEEKHLYLTPFDLEIELKTDSYSRSYYPPELLLKLTQNDREIDTQHMFKWDIWAFGCICLELLLYQSPPFISTSTKQQLRLISHFKPEQQLSDFQSSITNTLINSLNFEMNKRTISTHSIKEKVTQKCQVMTQIHPKSNSDYQFRESTRMKELNLHQGQGQCLMTLTILSLSNIVFEKQLRITVNADRAYNFFIDFDEKCSKKYILNRKLTIRSNLEDLEKWMTKPLLVQLKEQSRKSSITINLSSMILKVHGKRLWKDEIKGHYSSSADSSFSRARLKIKCLLEIPSELQATQEDEIEQRSPSISRKNDPEKGQKVFVQETKITKRVEATVSSKHKIPKKEMCSNIPSISQISQEIGIITQELKKKMGGENASDEIQKQLETLLEIETQQ